MQHIADETLMERIKNAQDREAFTMLMNRHKTHAYRLALQLTGDHDEAMDCAQEAFVKVFTRARRYQDGRQFWPWFVGILRNTVRMLRRTTRRRRKAGAEELIVGLPDHRDDPEAAARAAELWRRLLALPPKLREVMVLRHQEGFNYEQIAAVLGVSANTVASRLHAARQRLAQDHEM
ncbi:MAG TPA: sigma-70 family RNA polymerase sigma factor [bacterium]|nr:sigma-70 family RNA polymerase sigma factor [bacterium]